MARSVKLVLSVKSVKINMKHKGNLWKEGRKEILNVIISNANMPMPFMLTAVSCFCFQIFPCKRRPQNPFFYFSGNTICTMLQI